MISAIVVAAGKSSRMGDIDKLSLPFKDSTILGVVIDHLLISAVSEIVLVASDISLIPEEVMQKDIIIGINSSPENGLTSSIQTGVKNASPGHALLVCLGDMPLLLTEDYNSLINKYLINQKKAIIQPCENNRTGNPVLFSHHFREEILALESPDGCKPVVQQNNAFVDRIIVESDAFFTDIDTPDQYKAILKKLATN